MGDFKPLRVALLTSHSAPGIEQLIADPNRGAAYELALVVGSETTFAEARALDEAAIPLELRPLRKFFGDRGASFRNLRSRGEYDAELADVLLRASIDIVLLCGWNYILTDELLNELQGKVLAIHDADLSLRDPEGRRLYAGIHAVRQAVFAGEPETRSSVYVVTRDIARGPLLLLGQSFPVAQLARDARERRDDASLVAYANLHRRWMRSTGWGEMLVRTMEMVTAGTMQVIGDVVWFDGAPGPCRLGCAPRACYEPETMVARGIPRSCPFIE
ncbi:MAG: formyltransferase family protein [Thermoanaerobaculia bacterium]